MSLSLVPPHRLVMDLRRYLKTVLFRTCYAFTDPCYISLESVGGERTAVSLTPKA